MTKWLLSAVLILSFFTFSGLPARSTIKPQVQQSSLVISQALPQVRSISLKRALNQTRCACHPSLFLTSYIFNLATQHSKLITNIVKKHSSINLPKIQACFFYRVKAISPNTNDEPAISKG